MIQANNEGRISKGMSLVDAAKIAHKEAPAVDVMSRHVAKRFHHEHVGRWREFHALHECQASMAHAGARKCKHDFGVYR